MALISNYSRLYLSSAGKAFRQCSLATAIRNGPQNEQHAPSSQGAHLKYLERIHHIVPRCKHTRLLTNVRRAK